MQLAKLTVKIYNEAGNVVAHEDVELDFEGSDLPDVAAAYFTSLQMRIAVRGDQTY